MRASKILGLENNKYFNFNSPPLAIGYKTRRGGLEP